MGRPRCEMILTADEQLAIQRASIAAAVKELEDDGFAVKEVMDWHIENGLDMACERPETYRVICLIGDVEILGEMMRLHGLGKLETVDTEDIPF